MALRCHIAHQEVKKNVKEIINNGKMRTKIIGIISLCKQIMLIIFIRNQELISNINIMLSTHRNST